MPSDQPVVKTYCTVPMMALKNRKAFIQAIRTAKRVASGKRSAAACTSCKKGRARCDDTRPCKRCRVLGMIDGCSIQESSSDLKARGSGRSVCVREIETFPVQIQTSSELFGSAKFDEASDICVNRSSLKLQQALHDSKFKDDFSLGEPRIANESLLGGSSPFAFRGEFLYPPHARNPSQGNLPMASLYGVRPLLASEARPISQPDLPSRFTALCSNHSIPIPAQQQFPASFGLQLQQSSLIYLHLLGIAAQQSAGLGGGAQRL